jgi:hypothetical protein
MAKFFPKAGQARLGTIMQQDRENHGKKHRKKQKALPRKTMLTHFWE